MNDQSDHDETTQRHDTTDTDGGATPTSAAGTALALDPSDPAAPADGEPAGVSARMTSPWPLVTAAAIGAAVALALGVYGRLHEPTRESITTFGFPAVLPMKAWLATGAAVLALAQGVSAMWMWGRLPRLGPAPAGVAIAHRWTGTLAFLLTLPVAYHCLWSLGFQDTSTRVLAHSILGCAFYGAFVTKMLVLRSDRMPAKALPAMGALLVTLLVAIWWTSSWWFFTTFGVPGF